MDLPEVGNMSSTHSANPMACAVGLAVIEEIESRNLIEESDRKGQILKNKLNHFSERYYPEIFRNLLLPTFTIKSPDPLLKI